MADLPAIIAGMSPEQQRAAYIVLDAVSRPLTRREIEGAMIGNGVSRMQRRIVSKAVESLHIIALVGAEHG